jgi:hypothetical protein
MRKPKGNTATDHIVIVIGGTASLQGHRVIVQLVKLLLLSMPPTLIPLKPIHISAKY